ncbi:MAG TPA: TAXI family TRAP transporter solute-binding subunit [Rickettsiales bacterium]|nr:TAXI family TRAP transporter solute-binding subunit [Rickettsiales bacterium]
MKKLLTIFSLVFVVSVADSLAATKYISVGTGAITGVYYPAGGAICRLLNRGRKEHGVRCSVESTGGSVSNLNAIRSGALDFGIVQSDWLYHAYNGTGFFSDQTPFKDLRSVFSLYNETLAIAVLEKSDINKIDDLVGKRINFGIQGSGMYATMEVLVQSKGWTKEHFSEITYLQPSEQPKALCEGKIDAMVYMSGNPNGVLQEAAQTCKIRILSIDSETINSLINKNSFYVEAVIPGGMYPRNPRNIATFGVKSAIVVSKKASDEIVYQMTKAVFDNFDNFKTLHPVFATLRKEEMVKDGNAPVHPGAMRYFKEAGLVK